MNTPHSNCVIRVPAKDSYSTSGPTLMGRQSANEGFLKAWFKHSGHAEFWSLARFKEEAQVFARIGEAVHQTATQKPIYRWLSQNNIHRIGQVGTAYLPGPQVADVAWMRRRHPAAQATDFSIVGMTHTSCELPIQDALANMLTAPVYPWDAQICPSISVQTMVQRLLDDEAAWLHEHTGAVCTNRPQLPIVPLGVDCNKLDVAPAAKAKHRQRWRAKWQLGEQDICVLYMGRLDLRTKANLYPMLDALELAAQQLRHSNGPTLTLVLAGWFASEWDETTLRAAVLQACPSLRVIFEDGRPPEAREGVWHAADLFSSLVDNIQETFGLTPIEAMAASLPVVVTDYDGYRESVRDGIDGYRIRTWQPAAGEGTDLIEAHADVMLSYRDYVSKASAFVGIDMAQAASAYVKLAQDPALRQRMGAQGRARARQEYDWPQLIPRYMNLFGELASTRQQAATNRTSSSHSAGQRHPRRSDPFHSFSHYASATLGANMLLRAGPLLPTDALQREAMLALQLERPIYKNTQHLLNVPLLKELLTHVAEQADGLALQRWQASDETAAHLHRQVGWLIKAGLVQPHGGETSAQDSQASTLTRPHQATFTKIYQTNYWGNPESRSGPGSMIRYTANLRRHLPELFRKYNIATVLDAPCGDYNWMRLVVESTPIQYIGADIVQDIVESNQPFTSDRASFLQLDITTQPLPKADLMICRDCLFHLTYEDTKAFLVNFIEANIPYLLTTTHKNNQKFSNRNIKTGDFRRIDLFSAPYNLHRKPQERIDDWMSPEPEREMCLWSKEQIMSQLHQFTL
jgi:alpha-maltose-1-phosphate synthase